MKTSMNESKSVLLLLEDFLKAYLVERDAERSLSFLSRDISWYGTGENEDVQGLEQARQFFENELKVTPEAFQMKLVHRLDQSLPDGTGIAHVKCQITGGVIRAMCRCSAAVKFEDGVRKIYSLHMSVPDAAQQEGEFFPFSLTEQYEKELHDEFLNELVDGGVLGRYCEPSTEIFVVNRQLLDFLGYPSEEVFRRELNNSADNTIYPDDRKAGQEAIFEQLKTANRYRIEYRMLRRDGTSVWVESHGKMVDTKSGRKALVGIINDISAQKEAELKLRESEQRYRFALDGAGVNIWEYDIPNRRVILPQGSPMAQNSSGVIDAFPDSMYEKLGIGAEQFSAMKELFRRMEQGESKVSGDFWVNSPKTHTRWCERVSYSVVTDDRGRPVKAYGASFDVTESKLAEKRYQEELAYRDSVEESIIASCCVNLSAHIVESMRANGEPVPAQQCRNLIDCRRRSLLFLYDSSMTDEQNLRLSPEALIQSYNDGETVVSEEFLARLSEGHYVWMRTDVNLIKHPETDDVLAFFYHHDLTDSLIRQHVTETVLSQYYIEVGIVDFRSGLYRMSAGGGSVLAAGDECNYAESVDRFCDHRVADIDRERIRKQLRLDSLKSRIKEQGIFELQFLGIATDGAKRYYQMRFQNLDGNTDVMLITRQDIDELVKKEQAKQAQLEQAVNYANNANRVKSEFLSRMSHEIRTPLNAIIGLAELGRVNLTRDQPSRTEGMDYVLKTLDSSHYLLSLINDILDMSKIEGGEISLVREPMDCLHILDSVRTIIGTQAAAKGVRFDIEQNGNCPQRVMGDSTRVEQVLINLLGNAVKFTPHGGEVRLTIDKLADDGSAVTMRFTVADTGVGISPEFLPRIFEPFAQEYAGITSSYGGSGLGLPIARQLTRMMGGDLSATSVKGEGSVFTAIMRFETPDEAEFGELPKEKQSSGGACLCGARILVCEDHPLNVMVVKRLLEQQGCEVHTAENGRLGVQAFADSEPGYYDAVLMDIRMPEMDGLEAARRLRTLERPDAAEVPIIAMTANAYDEDVRLSKEAGMNAHLAKPIEPSLLFDTLASILRRNEANEK